MFDAILEAVDFGTVAQDIAGIAALIAACLVVFKGTGWLLDAIKYRGWDKD